MYVNKCIKCGREFETKNPKRVICPDCLYPDKKMMVNSSESGDSPATSQPAEQTPVIQLKKNRNSIIVIHLEEMITKDHIIGLKELITTVLNKVVIITITTVKVVITEIIDKVDIIIITIAKAVTTIVKVVATITVSHSRSRSKCDSLHAQSVLNMKCRLSTLQHRFV